MFTVGKRFILHGSEAEVRGNIDGEYIVFKCASFDFGHVYKGYTKAFIEYALRRGEIVEKGNMQQ